MRVEPTTTLFAQRRTLLRSALEPLITTGKVSAQVLTYIDHLYDRHLYFEAERIAGLALWIGKDVRTAWRETCFEGFGTVLRACATVVHGLALMDTRQTGESHVHSRKDSVTAYGLSLPVYTRWCQLGQRLVSVPTESLPERGRWVRQLCQWLSGAASLTEIGILHTRGSRDTPISLAAVETAAAEAVRAILTVSRCLWHVWVQRAWAPLLPSCEDLLVRELGVGTALGHALIALGHDVAVWDSHPQAMARLEVVVTVLAQQTMANHVTAQHTGREDSV